MVCLLWLQNGSAGLKWLYGLCFSSIAQNHIDNLNSWGPIKIIAKQKTLATATSDLIPEDTCMSRSNTMPQDFRLAAIPSTLKGSATAK